MAPTPQKDSPAVTDTGARPVVPSIPPPLQQDDVVISGLSGLYPTCHNVNEFSVKLYNHENFTASQTLRWNNTDNPEVSKYCGTVPDLEKFDAQYFMIHYHLAHMTDIMTRKLLEQAYQAIIDSGTCPAELSGKNVGVFIGATLSEYEMLLTTQQGLDMGGNGILGCNRTMFSNRISYWLNAKGPSVTLDSSSASALVCMEKAYEAIRRGDCDAAIVGGSNVHLSSQAFIHYDRMMGVNPDGKTKSFDKHADGICPSECISVVFLQKAKDAKRIYANICHVKTQFSTLDANFADRYGPFRNPSALSSFYSEFYEASNVLPQDVEYVEAFGSAIREADKIELDAIEKVFCKNRYDPLLIGSVMSNMGFSYAASAQAALTKVCLAYQTGKIAANLHYETPRDDVPAIRDGRMRVVTDNRPFRRSYTAINSVSLTGLDGHLLLKGEYKPKVKSYYESKIPYLLTASARQESGVEFIFNDFMTNPLDPEVIALFHNIQKTRDSKHLARGYAIMTNDENNKTVCVKQKVDYHDVAKRPLWFVYSGMGSQWNGMGRELMRIPIFAAAIRRCQEVMKPKGIDVIRIITSENKKIFDDIINCFVGITAVQIGLTDILFSMGLVPDNLIGHSMGEMGCGYADGCVTADEMLLAAYYRGLVSVETPVIKGTMAAVGIGAQKIVSMCPPEVVVACHNSSESCTLSGPFDIMADFIAKLTEQGIFARAVNSAHRAYHSHYVEAAAPGLLKYLKSFLTPRPRSKKWLSTSVPKEKWDTPAAQMNSAEYHVNNMLSPVLFEETAQAIPANAVVIEVAPHGLLQAILKRSLSTCTNVPLTRRGHPDGVIFLLEAIGGLYQEGFNPDISVLYPKVQFPVSTETRSLSHLVEWVHDEKWKVPAPENNDKTYAAAYDTTLSTYDDEYRFLRGNIIDGKNVFPMSGALVFVWDTLAMAMDVKRKTNSVQFNDVHFHIQPQISDHRLMKFGVSIHKGTGYFEILSENIILASGYVQALSDVSKGYYKKHSNESDEMVYNSDDIYSLFYDKGFGYGGEFRSIQKGNADLTQVVVTWDDNWVTLIDAVIQINLLRRDSNTIEYPRYIQQLNIDVKQHHTAIQTPASGSRLLEACHFKELNATRCGGIVLRNILFKSVPPHEHKNIGLTTLKFVPHYQTDVINISTALSTFLQIMAENVGNELNALDITDQKCGSCLYNEVKQLLPELSGINLTINLKTKEDIHKLADTIQLKDFILVDNAMDEICFNELIGDVIPSGTFVVVLEEGVVSQSMYKVVASAITPKGRLVLGRWKFQTFTECSNVISVTSPKDIPQLKLARNSLSANARLNVLTYYPPLKELKDLMEQWRKESGINKIFITMASKTSLKVVKEKQLWKNIDLPFAVIQNGINGGYYFVSEEQSNAKEPLCVALTNVQVGNLDSLCWIERPKPNPSSAIVVSVRYAGLNSYDATKATADISGSINEESCLSYGMDFSGHTASGNRVMGVIRHGAASTQVSAEESLLWPVPEHWTLEDAATVPLAYAHAFYCLGIKCKLYQGMNVLVNGASGALGQAVISIALANKCEVYAAVSNIKKKQMLRRIFPSLPGNSIGNSRDASFGDMVLSATRGNGCDIVVSCVKGGLKNLSLSCCAAWGTTIDTQNVHSPEAFTYGMYNMTKCRSYIASDFSAVFEPENHEERKQLLVMVSEGIARGYVRPLSRVTYGAHESARALRLLANSRHFGRALLHIHGEVIPYTRRLEVNNSGSYLVLSATSDNAVALRLIDLLVQRGAVSISLHQEQNSNGAFMRLKIRQWEKLGANVKITFGAYNDAEKYEELIKAYNYVTPIDSLYVIVDGTSNEHILTRSRFLVTYLDEISRKNCSSMRLFAVISNDADIGRNICINRTMDGYPSLMLQLPAIEKIDISESNIDKSYWEKETIQLRDVIPILENAICLSRPVAVVYTRKTKKTFIKEITEVANLVSKADENIKIKELCFNMDKSQKILQIAQQYDIVLPKKKVEDLTVAQLRELEESSMKSKSRAATGLDVLFSSVDTDELLQDIIYLSTPSKKSSLRGDDFDANAEYLIMIPGIDGQYKNFESISSRLKLYAAVVLPGLENINETVSEIAQRLVKVILKRLCPKERFYIMGYSFGVLIAMKVAALLEDTGLTGVVYCVDASPDAFPLAVDAWLCEEGATNAELLQDVVVQHTYKLMTGSTSDQLASLLQEATTWNDKVLTGIRALRNKVPHSTQYMRTVMEAAYKRIAQARQYDSSQLRPLRSQIVFFRSQFNTHTFHDLSLARFSEQKVHVYDITADHATALNDVRCASIVNRHLHQKTLVDFSSRNLCNTYLPSGNSSS